MSLSPTSKIVLWAVWFSIISTGLIVDFGRILCGALWDMVFLRAARNAAFSAEQPLYKFARFRDLRRCFFGANRQMISLWRSWMADD
jgi:hypothetical protein